MGRCEKSVKHDMWKTRLFKCWSSMHDRCGWRNGKPHKWYSGIHVCEEWNTFIPFMEWSKKNGYNDTMTLDRINPRLGYSPLNCRWVSKSEQQRCNKRNTVYVEIDGVRDSLAHFCIRYNIKYKMAWQRINNLGWSPSDAVKVEVSKKEMYRRVSKSHSKQVICNETGETFPSITECAKHFNVRTTMIQYRLNRKTMERTKGSGNKIAGLSFSYK